MNVLCKLCFISLLLCLVMLTGICQTENQRSKYPAYVGDIDFDPNTDSKEFKLCFEKMMFQYFNNSQGMEYLGEKKALDKIFFEQFRSDSTSNESGLIRIRFVVNCKGETDRFRVLAMDNAYNPKSFSPFITNQLLNIAKNLKGWLPKKYKNTEIDYYQYLIFKMENGILKEVLP